jgi:hypothetical protein
MPLIHSEQSVLVLGAASFWHWEKSTTDGPGAAFVVLWLPMVA